MKYESHHCTSTSYYANFKQQTCKETLSLKSTMNGLQRIPNTAKEMAENTCRNDQKRQAINHHNNS